jgi:hypothetical protein
MISNHPCFAGPLDMVHAAIVFVSKARVRSFKFQQETEHMEDNENNFRQYKLIIMHYKAGAFNRSPK